jgi:hypothetical protein
MRIIRAGRDAVVSVRGATTCVGMQLCSSLPNVVEKEWTLTPARRPKKSSWSRVGSTIGTLRQQRRHDMKIPMVKSISANKFSVGQAAVRMLSLAVQRERLGMMIM